MTQTLLLDLDDTLLGNPMDTFVRVYTRALAKQFTAYVEPGKLIQCLLLATGKMAANQRPDRTMEEVFDAEFYPAIGVTKEEVAGTIEAFYRDVFPTFKDLTEYWPEAVRLVEGAFERGYQVGIATNPLFPRSAIIQRLEWAGLSPEKYPFILIPDYQTFHFAKPNPAYFAEWLAQAGWPEGPVIMVGDALDMDILSARQMGLSAYWIPRDGASPSAGPAPSATGKHADLLNWLDTTPEEKLIPDYSTIQAILSILRSTPAALDVLKDKIPAQNWIIRPAQEEWCLAEIVCHLRDVEQEVNLPRFEKITQEENPFLPGMDTDPWANTRQYIIQDCMEATEAFTNARIQSLNILDRLSPESWKRTARHSIFGPTELKEIVRINASHDRLHIQQIHQVLRATLAP
ncbi:MAG: DinB family protein [Omnitrophica WOR_2 bacterium]